MARNFRSTRMTKTWSNVNIGGSANLASASTNILGLVSVVLQPETILRAIGEVFVSIRTATTALDEAIITFGLGIVSADAASAGGTSMPDPADEPEYPWMWWHTHHFFSAFAVDGTGSDEFGVGMIRIPVLTKAMRKVKPQQAVVLLAQYEDIAGTPALRVGGHVRCLVAR